MSFLGFSSRAKFWKRWRTRKYFIKISKRSGRRHRYWFVVVQSCRAHRRVARALINIENSLCDVDVWRPTLDRNSPCTWDIDTEKIHLWRNWSHTRKNRQIYKHYSQWYIDLYFRPALSWMMKFVQFWYIYHIVTV